MIIINQEIKIKFLDSQLAMKNNQTIGILRNKFAYYTQNKQKLERRKNRFKVMDRDESTPRLSDNLLTCASSTNNSIQSLQMTSNLTKDYYEEARQKLFQVVQLQKKMSVLTKTRLSTFKQRQNERLDEQISKLAVQATNLLSQSQKLLKKLGSLQYKKESQQKMIKNIQISLAQQIRSCSRSLRLQQRSYYNTIHQYQSSSSNPLQLSQQQRKMFQVSQQQIFEQSTPDVTENHKINQLVQSINKLSTIYKELNNLVIQQGSLVDRIDINIQQTMEHTVSAVKHLEAANQHATSTFADKIIKILVVLIITMAFTLGLKYMN